MATIDSLRTVRDNILAKLVEISENPKPNYSVDGQTVSHADYLESLLRSLDATNRVLASVESFEYVEQLYL